jgi:phosphoglucomutase
MIKTIVTNQMGSAIAQKYGVKTIETLTGFKYIGEQIHLLEQSMDKQFIFGYEESYGYLTDTFVRDKDGIMASLLISEMAAFYKKQNKTLCDILQQLYQEHGFFQESLQTRTFTGKEGKQKMEQILQTWRTQPPKQVGSFVVKQICDYHRGERIDLLSSTTTTLSLPKENVLHFTCMDDSWFCIRPSGTEPKMKIYFATQGKTYLESREKLKNLTREILRQLDESS